ncbi:SpaA isopeptide-forming pilin-related protein [Bifidobacterium crudilactis]|jgi:hypothetical protein|uniref:SpaA isopeptide-forming pilin-related protein n=1 Tax=Bifidobacterium crudilactis TaxID=327277 RepID=UPI002F3579EB
MKTLHLSRKVTTSLVVAAFALGGLAAANVGVQTAQAASDSQKIELTAPDVNTARTVKAYKLGTYNNILYTATGDLKSVEVVTTTYDAGSDPALGYILTAAQTAGGGSAVDATNPLGWVAANWLGYGSASNDTTSGRSPYAGNLQDFAAALAGIDLAKLDASPVEVSGLDDNTETITVTDAGLYLIVDTTAVTAPEKKSLPIIVGTKAWNATQSRDVDFADAGTDGKPELGNASLKIVDSLIEKNITNGGDADGFNIGDTVDYEITIPVPDLTTYNSATYELSKYKYDFKDTFSAGLTPPDVNDIKVYVGSNNTDVAPTLLSSNSIKLVGQVLTIEDLDVLFTKDNAGVVANNDVPVGTIIRIVYSATINDKALSSYAPSEPGEVNTDNTAELTYSSDPSNDTTYTTTEDEDPDVNPTAYVFGVDFTKVDKDDNTKKLGGAGFTVKYLDEETNTKIARKFVALNDSTPVDLSVDANTDNVPDNIGTVTRYRLATADEQSGTLAQGVTDTIWSQNDTTGKFKFEGVQAGTYEVTETKAPADHYTIDPFEVTVTPTWNEDGEIVESIAYSIEYGDQAAWISGDGTTVLVADPAETLANLPYTGGIGIAIFLIVGATVTIIGVRAHRQSAKAETAATAV